MIDQVEKSLNGQLEKSMAEWGSDNLLGIWIILQMPQWGEDGAYLDENDIAKLKKYALELRAELGERLNDAPIRKNC